MTEKLRWKNPNAIVSCYWLNNNLNNPNIRIFDCTTYLHYRDNDPTLPYIVESGREKYEKIHITNSIFMDLHLDLSDEKSPYRFTLPKLEILAEKFKRLGVGSDLHIVLYSRNGAQWSARLWWMLRSVGIDNVSILDGGFNEWEKSGLPTSQKILTFPPADFVFTPRENIFINKQVVIDAIDSPDSIILNSLTADIHKGLNPRYGRPGRIPKSKNIPFHELLDSETGRFKPIEELTKIFDINKITKDKNIVNYCGGGIAASLEAFVLYQLGFKNILIYDNSLHEWAAIDQTLPMEKD
ncbi:rhodanese-like domain-containing protein [Alphaproteobacteria bacterium]|nr:rhodanese-like domain-containing protein [Alphaproteobacteria bacterium]